MKKFLRTALCFLLLLSMVGVLAACTGDGNDASSAASGGTTSTPDPGSEYMDENGVYTPKKGVLDEYKGRTFTILVVGDAGTYQSDDFTTEQGDGGIDYGTNYYEAVKSRNQKVEETYGVTLEVKKEANAYSLADQDATAGTQLYDALLLGTGSMATLARSGLLCDLKTLENIDIDAPWWDAGANEAFSIAGKLFFTTGDITIMNKANTWSIVFNKQLIEQYNLESPYDLFRQDKWTFDKMIEMATKVSNATANAEWDEWNNPDVTYGMVAAYGDIAQFYGSAGMMLCQKNAQDEPALLFGTDESSINLAVRILDTFNGAPWKIYAESLQGAPGIKDIWEDSFALLYTGRALFRPSGFTAVAKMRTRADIEFGIVPMPKMTEEQNEYTTVANSGYSAGITKTCEDPEFSAYMLDAFAAASKYNKTGGVTYEYLETTLKGRNSMDDESREMVDFIFSHISYDIGRIYNFGNLSTTVFYNHAKASTNTVRSSFEGISGTIDSDIQETIMDYEANT